MSDWRSLVIFFHLAATSGPLRSLAPRKKIERPTMSNWARQPWLCGCPQLLQLESIADRENVHYDSGLHLSVAMRSFRAENVSNLVKQVLDLDAEGAKATLDEIGERYPIVITRDLDKAKAWLKNRANGSERYGIVVSSQANRLKPLAIDVRFQPNPIHWFLAGKEDVRSS